MFAFSCIFVHMKVYLIGYMASGNTRTGRKLARMLDYSFSDTDDLFESKFRISIHDFFDKYGEDLFRQLEQKVLLETTTLDNTVISTGGGTPCFFDNMGFIMKSGISVYLKLSSSALASRLKVVRKKRPLLKGMTASQVGEFVDRQLKEREEYYSKADIVVEGNCPDIADLARRIRELSVTSH